MKKYTYKDSVSGEILYVDEAEPVWYSSPPPSDEWVWRAYFKDPHRTILHRKDGPAIEYASGSYKWYQNNMIHRMDGPASRSIDGSLAWWIDGVRIDTLNSKNT